MKGWQDFGSRNSSYKKDKRDAIRDATPQTITVVLGRFEPVPPPPGISRCRVQGKLAQKLSKEQGSFWAKYE
jgi:hypothetical protein